MSAVFPAKPPEICMSCSNCKRGTWDRINVIYRCSAGGTDPEKCGSFKGAVC